MRYLAEDWSVGIAHRNSPAGLVVLDRHFESPPNESFQDRITRNPTHHLAGPFPSSCVLPKRNTLAIKPVRHCFAVGVLRKHSEPLLVDRGCGLVLDPVVVGFRSGGLDITEDLSRRRAAVRLEAIH